MLRNEHQASARDRQEKDEEEVGHVGGEASSFVRLALKATRGFVRCLSFISLRALIFHLLFVHSRVTRC